jgi:trans-AT polyketide synthase/acyltransferase/oxidoreductase domain-containing protein
MLFPGQGSQKKGMGADLFSLFPAETAAADAILGYSVREQCVDDPGGRLRETQYTQPLMFTVCSLMYLKRIGEAGRRPDAVAGHSVGELAALFAAGVFDFETGLKIVKKRGELMSRATGGGMAAVIGLTADQIRDALQSNGHDRVDLANLNAPQQSVISGRTDDVLATRPVLESAGAKMFVPLEVSGAFHSRGMQQARAEFEAFVRDFTFAAPAIPVIANVSALPYGRDEILDNICRQITSPVRWADSMLYLLQRYPGAEFEEVGPGTVLTSLLRQVRMAMPS